MFKLNEDFNKKSTLFLSGGGPGEVTEEIDSYFINKVLPQSEHVKILYIPVAKSGDMNAYKKSLNWVKTKFSPLDKNDRIEFILCTKLEKFISLSEYDAVYIGGGNTYRLLHLIYKSHFDKLLIEYIKSGGIVYGASAGTVLFGQDISTYIEDKYLPENIKHKYIEEKGIPMLGNYSLLTHFEDGDEDKVVKYFNSHQDSVISIPPGVALVVKKDNSYKVGGKDILIYRPNGEVEKMK
jgi:dipeptidase E